MKATRASARLRRHRRVRKKVFGTAEIARLCVYRSNTHIYAQVIDDSKGEVLAAASSLKAGQVKPGDKETRRLAEAKAVGVALAEAAKSKGIERVKFDRGGYRYHGRVAALAEAAREGGLKF